MKEKIQDLPVFISRKEIAAMLGISKSCLHENEAALGLDRCKVQWKLRHARYVRSMVMAIIQELSSPQKKSEKK